MSESLRVQVPLELLQTIYAGAKTLYPRESFLLLRGKKKKGIIRVSDLVMAPFTVHGLNSAHFNPYMLPADFSLIGTVHSHPSGSPQPPHG